jgi:preprotein translocase subunit SecY
LSTIGRSVPLPGIDPTVWERMSRRQSGGLLGMVNLFSEGAASQMPIFALNLGPYLSAVILLQVALLFSSRLRAVRDCGDRGRQIVR